MQVSYVPWLVLLSVVVGVAGGYIGLRLAMQVATAAGAQRRLLLAAAAFAFGAATWTMHFMGLLAARLPFTATYLALPTLLSFLICVLVAGAAVYVARSGPFTPLRLIASSCALGASIVTLHLVAMTALQASARVSQAWAFAVAGLLVAIAGSALALWLALGRPERLQPMPAALAFGLAVAAAHFTDLAGTTLNRQAAALPAAPVLSASSLAIVVVIVAFGVFGLFLLLLVPDRAEAGTETLKPAPAPAAEYDEVPVAAGASASGGDTELRRGIYAPLGGAGAPPPRLAEHLPIERDGATHFVPVEEVVAVQANAHYTYLFDGTAKLFCPLAIGEVESRLDRSRFMRVHRSHIVNIERVSGFKRSGDSETVELVAEERYTVPVSRSRAGSLKARIGEKNGGSEPQT